MRKNTDGFTYKLNGNETQVSPKKELIVEKNFIEQNLTFCLSLFDEN